VTFELFEDEEMEVEELQAEVAFDSRTAVPPLDIYRSSRAVSAHNMWLYVYVCICTYNYIYIYM